MSKNLPYYPLHVSDFDEDPNVLKMDLAAVGLYILALNEAWKRGSIPGNLKELAMLIRRPHSDVKRSWNQVKTCWIDAEEPGRLINKRQEKERLIAKQRVSHGAKAAAARWAADGDAQAMPEHMPEQCNARLYLDLSSSSESKSSSEKKEFLKNQEKWF